VTQADTTALVSTTLNPALTNQNVTFVALVSPVISTAVQPTGMIQFVSNGTNALGGPISLTNSLANVTVLAAALGRTNAVITAEYSDPAGNFNGSTNSVTQNIVIVTMPPPGKMSLVPSFAKGMVTANLSGTANTTYIIQASTDLVHWLPIYTNVADVNGLVSLIDTNAGAYPRRFYRAYSP
jgi:hypothetical protein